MKKTAMFVAGALFGALIMISSTALGADVIESITAKYSSSLNITLNGKQVELKQGALNYNDTNYLSVREVAAAAGLDVKWNDDTQTVELSSKSVTPSPSPDGSVSGKGGDSMNGVEVTTFNGMKAVKVNEITYFDGNQFLFKIESLSKENTMTWNEDYTVLTLKLNGKSTEIPKTGDNFFVHYGITYINAKYYE